MTEIDVKIPCEIYQRVVGYMRPLDACNKGKKEEIRQRKMLKFKELFNGSDIELVGRGAKDFR